MQARVRGCAAATVLVLLVAWAIGAWRYADLPEQVPTHWAWDGTPDTFRDRSVTTVFLPLIVALALAVALHLAGAVGAAAQRSGGEAWARMQGTQLRVVLAEVALAESALIAGLAVSGWLSPGMRAPGWLLWLLVAAFLVAVVCSLTAAQRRLRASAASPPLSAGEERHWAGPLYRNPDDARVWVPRRTEVGLTLNLGRPLGAALALAAGLVPIVVVIGLLVRR